MDLTDIARWQFGITTVFHFWFVPVTIGTSAIVAVFETLWVRTQRPEYLRLTKFFGKLFLINFAIGVVTGIVQEFQFGMNWSAYSRFVGDVFGAPLAVEGLLAFFLESTFLGLWIFGWDRLPRRLHAATIWLVHIGTLLSAYFILAANSWMQHPVGYRYNARSGRAELTDFWAVMFNKVQLVTFPHVITACYMTAGAFVMGVGIYLHHRNAGADGPQAREDGRLFIKAARIGAAITLVAGIGVAISGDAQGKVMTEVQPMKMAAAEALYNSEKPASFSLFTIGTPDGKHEKFAIKVPGLLSFLATGHFNGRVQGIDQLRKEYAHTYGQDPGAAYFRAGGYVPDIPVTYWSFRLMIGLGVLGGIGGALVLWLTRRGRSPGEGRWARAGLFLPVAVVFASSFGWIFTEMGRQPWAVFGLMTTSHAVSPGVSVTEAFISVVALTGLYAVLAVIELGLMWRFIKIGPPTIEELAPAPDDDSSHPIAFAY